MSHRNRRPDWRRIKSLRSYTIDEAASTLRVHRNAIRHWMKKGGLLALTDRRPFLIRGADLVAFLKGRRAAKRQRCTAGQLYCVKCRKPQTPAGGMTDYEPLKHDRGALVAICPVCETLMRRFVSKARLSALERDFDLKVTHHQESLVDTTLPSASCHFHSKD
jgi:excisionase family DNA binding protein